MVGSGERKKGSEILASHLRSRSEQADRLTTIPTALCPPAPFPDTCRENPADRRNRMRVIA